MIVNSDKLNRCVIITAGPIGPLKPLKELLRPDDFIVCADGGLTNARKLGARADVLIGDMDSLPVMQHKAIETLLYQKEKNETDTILAIEMALERGYRRFLILGGLRGRLDHTVANLSALCYIYRHGGEGHIADANNEVYLLPSGEIRIPRHKGYYVSVFPFEGISEGVTEIGLKYPLENAVLDCGFPLGVSNEFTEEEAVISVKKGTLIIILSKR